MENEDILYNSELVLKVDITKITATAINHWPQQFVVEVSKDNGEYYCLDSLHQICCGLQRALRAAGNTNVNFIDGK